RLDIATQAPERPSGEPTLLPGVPFWRRGLRRRVADDLPSRAHPPSPLSHAVGEGARGVSAVYRPRCGSEERDALTVIRERNIRRKLGINGVVVEVVGDVRKK